MPVVNIYYTKDNRNELFFAGMADIISEVLRIPEEKIWIFWNKKKKSEYFKPDWINNLKPAPVLLIQCRESYTKKQVLKLIESLTGYIVSYFNCHENEVFISFLKIKKGDLFSQGKIWI